MTNLVLHEDLNKFKETLSLKEEAFATDLTKLENEFLELNRRLNPYLLKTENCLKN